jgi:hypothetical protein
VRVVEGLRLIPGGAVPVEPVATDPVVFQRECVDAFVASWRARGFSPVTIDNDIGLLERTLAALGRPAWEVTSEDIDRVVGVMSDAQSYEERGSRLTEARRNDTATKRPDFYHCDGFRDAIGL